MRKRTNKTPNRIEFERQLKRIRKGIRGLQKQGYVVDNSVLGRTNYQRYTKQAINRLKEITPKVLRANAVHETPTGEIISGEEYYRLRRRVAALKGWETRRARIEPSAQATVGAKAPTLNVKQYLTDTLNSRFSEIAKDQNAQKILNSVSSAIKTAETKLLYDNETYISSQIAEIRIVYDSDQEEAVKMSDDLSVFITRLTEKTSLFDTVSALGYYENEEEYNDYD